ncbi:MAG: Malate/L-lactate dehydrogenase [Bacteroidetes bacterium]|jgi:LDH2 family malate/lactate/ureidoglycolate dehydrogenase|nr:Malate/L-lactate dehydrogenase [Bacteroidota bacterium]
MEKKFIPFAVLEKFLVDVMVKAGIPEEDAGIVADVLIQADKLGFDSHGVNRLKGIYLDRINEGILNPVTNYTIIRESPSTAVIDGQNGMGHVISYNAMKLAIEKAKKYGMGMVAVRNSSHYGFAGYYPLMAVRENMIGITGTNARPSVAPTFGVENMLGTNPLTFGIPSDEPFPFLLDCATSITQRGKIELYARTGKELPKGWVMDVNGESKTNASEVLEDIIAGNAALMPLGGVGEDTGGYKGYGYAAVVEILSAALQQGAFMKMLTGSMDGKKVPYRIGHFFIVIDINAFTEPEDFKETTGKILRELRDSRKMPGQTRIYTAGEKEYFTWLERKDKGVPFSDELLEEFRGLCKTYHLEEFLPDFEA